MKLTEEYIDEKIHAYNIAIDGLRFHESDTDTPRSKELREWLADKLEREIDRWIAKYVKR